MSFNQHIESRKEYSRLCDCGVDHDVKLIQGLFHYVESSHVAFCVALIEHQNEKHIWVALITGEWPNTGQQDCYVCAHIWSDVNKNRIMRIEDATDSPFDAKDIFDCYAVTRDQVLAVQGGKEWVIDTYLNLFKLDNEIGAYIDQDDA